MNTFNKLSENLQQIVFDKIFKKEKDHNNTLINQQIKNLFNDYNCYITDNCFTPSLLEKQECYEIKNKNKFLDISNNPSTKYLIEKCDFCNNNGCIIKSKDIPYYNSHLLEKEVYKSKKNYTKFYNMRFIEKSKLNYRCSWFTNLMCTSCYHGTSYKKISTQFYCHI